MLPAELKTILIAASPFVELRGAIPVALKFYGFSFLKTFFLSITGNLISAVFLLLFLEPVSKYLREHFLIFEKFFSWLFARTRRLHQKKFEKWKKFALVILVAIPLPFTGAWTGSICAFLFGIRFWQAVFLILAGLLAAATFVILITVS